jgi:hypothetical protein
MNTGVRHNAERAVRMVGRAICMRMRHLNRPADHDQQDAQQRKENSPRLVCAGWLAG